jgi:hypothetical protein
MPGLAQPVTDERDALREFLGYFQRAYFAVAYGLTDQQARSTPCASALSIGGLIKHVTAVQRIWLARVRSAPDLPPPDPRPTDEQYARHQANFVMGDDETLAQLLAELAAENAECLRILADADLDTAVPVPHDVPWLPKDVQTWSVRWVINHLIGELSRHAGHADIIRESIDGATLYNLIAGLEGSPETDWTKPWQPQHQPAE